MNKNILALLFALMCVTLNAQRRPEIGLTLSGGGAKGLAHIGLLQAIDSAGLKIDFVTGTSMGAIVGSLYSIGYSGKDIEAIAKKIDWSAVLTNRSPLNRISMEEKPEYSKYALELPVVNKKVQIPSGVIKGQELWTTLQELYFPVHDKDDFYDFDMPFKCVATDVVTGKEVVMDCGDITRAVRASMAIPMVFTSVDTLDYRLVDGGIVRNFPVRDVVEMGSDYVIGSSVSSGLVPEEELNNVVDIILQIVFLKEGEDYGSEVELCDYFVQMPIDEFSTGSFDKAADIIKVGKQHAFETAYPHFKRLADSLNHLHPVENRESRLPELDSVLISEVQVRGLKGWDKAFFLDLIDFQPYTYYHPDELSELVRKAYGTRFYSQVAYQLESDPNGPTKIIFSAEENARTQLKFGVHYTEFSGISALFNITKRDFLFHNSRSYVKLNVGENIRLRAEHLQYLGKKKNLALIPSVDYNMLDFTIFDDFDADGLQRLRQVRTELRLQHVGELKHATGFGGRFEWGRIIPTLNAKVDQRGENNFLSLFAYHRINTTNRQFFPTRGLQLYAEGAWVTNQYPSIRFFEESTEIPQPANIDISDEAYARFLLNADLFIPLSSTFNLIFSSQTGLNFNNQLNVLNNFRIGGLSQNRLFDNQITFSGLTENTKTVASASALSASLRYAWRPNIYFSAQSNVGIYDFLPNPDENQTSIPFLSGHSISVAYDSPIGPISLTGTYSDQSQNLGYFVNLGIGFY